MRGIRLLPATFLLTPLREGRHEPLAEGIVRVNFYSRPCGRGDTVIFLPVAAVISISTHAPAGGATRDRCTSTAG